MVAHIRKDMVTLVNYGLGNIKAFYNIYAQLKIPVQIATNKDQLKYAKKIILPGVGSFDWAMTRLNESGLRDTLDELVVDMKIPVLGVCVGMQMFTNYSEEGKLPGLGWIDGAVKRFDETLFNSKIDLPHMGWNEVVPVKESPLFQELVQPRFYFLHSYHVIPVEDANVLASTNYGLHFTSAIEKDNMYGVQFHPEKSHKWGIQLLKNFAEL